MSRFAAKRRDANDSVDSNRLPGRSILTSRGVPPGKAVK